MHALRGLALLLLCQSVGEAVARGLAWPLPGPVLGMLLMLGLLACLRPGAFCSEPPPAVEG